MAESEFLPTSVSDWKQVRDPKPLKYYRPPLRSDPRSLIERASQLTLQESTNFINVGSNQELSSAISSVKRNTRAQDRLAKLKSNFPKTKHATFRVINGEGPFGYVTSEPDISENCAKSALPFEPPTPAPPNTALPRTVPPTTVPPTTVPPYRAPPFRRPTNQVQPSAAPLSNPPLRSAPQSTAPPTSALLSTGPPSTVPLYRAPHFRGPPTNGSHCVHGNLSTYPAGILKNKSGVHAETSSSCSSGPHSKTVRPGVRFEPSVTSFNNENEVSVERQFRRETVYDNSAKRSVKDSRDGQSWRLGTHAAKHQDIDSGFNSPDESPVCSTPLLPEDGPTCGEIDDQRPCHSRNGAFLHESNQPTVSNQNCDSNLETDISTDQSFSSDCSEEIECLNPNDPVPKPILLLPVEAHLRYYTPSQDMDQSGSSSGVSSLSQKTDESFFSCSQHESLFSASREIDNSSPGSGRTSVDSAFDVGHQRFESSSPKKITFTSGPSSNRRLEVDLLCEPSSSQEKAVNMTHGSISQQEKEVSNGDQSSTIEKPVSSSCNSWRGNGPSNKSSHFENQGADSSDMSSMGLPTSFGTPGNLKRKAYDSPRTASSIEEAVETCFSKRYEFKPSDWKLPAAAQVFSTKPWESQNFMNLKEKLNSVKDELNDMSLNDWHAHTRRRNKAGNVIWQLRKKIDPEFPTQAWCKFYENVSSFNLVPQKAVDQKSLQSVHLCEAPGAFITSLNHFLHVNYGSDFKFDWRAVTLNPYYEGNPLSCMINDDRLILKTLDKWLFGQDNTGDLLNRDNLLDIIDKTSELGEVLLVTADGSIDCQDNPAEQEDIVSWLHYCETVAALMILAPGGSFLIKMFTFYEHASICLLYLLNCVFNSVAVNKPVTSKEGNSEVYVVCLGFKGKSAIQPWVNVLLKNYGPKAPENALFPMESIPLSFLDQVYLCADQFRKLQSDVIKENIRSFHCPEKKDSYRTASLRHKIADNFFRRYNITKLDRSFYLVDKRFLKDAETPNIDPRFEEGSFNDRRKRMALSPEEELKYLKDDLLHLNVAWPCDNEVFWLDFPANPSGFKIVRGKPITKVNSSKFCLGRLLKLRNRVREIAYDHFKVSVPEGSSASDVRDDREILWPDDQLKRKVFTLDFQNQLWTSLEDGNAFHEKDACKKILAAIESKVFRDDCLELRGYPMLTQFNVGLVYLLGHLFEKVGLVRPKGQDIRILFYNYRKFHPKMSEHWQRVVSDMEHDREAILSVVQISEISDGDFYKYVTEINNLCVVEQIKDLLHAMSVDS